MSYQLTVEGVKMSEYRKLGVFVKSYELSISLYRYTKHLPKEERYGLVSQIRRASTSIPLNIAEGYGKDDTKRETVRYLRMAKGSCAELSVLLDMCNDLNLMEDVAHCKYMKCIEEISKMLYGLIKSFQTHN